MTLRTRFLITALFLCHQVTGAALVTSQLPLENSAQKQDSQSVKSGEKANSSEAEASTPCGRQAAGEDSDSTTICALQQEKIGDVYKLHGSAEIHYRGYILHADEVTYNSDTGEATGTGHLTLDGGPNDDHIKASRGSYNLTAETGRFYDATGTTGWHF